LVNFEFKFFSHPLNELRPVHEQAVMINYYMVILLAITTNIHLIWR